MSWLSHLNPFKRKYTPHAFTDDEREDAQIARLKKAIKQERVRFLREKLERLKEQQEEAHLEEEIADMEQQIDPPEEEDDSESPVNALGNPDALLMQLLGNVLAARSSPQPSTPPPQQGILHGQKETLTDEQLREMKAAYTAQYPQYVKMAKKMSDEQLLGILRQKQPELLERYDEDTIARALKVLRAKD